MDRYGMHPGSKEKDESMNDEKQEKLYISCFFGTIVLYRVWKTFQTIYP